MCACSINVFAILTLLPLIWSSVEVANDNSQLSQDVEVNGTESRILSRRKRFLVFPDGSSVQIVFETQNHGYLNVGDIVWFSNTAALAWDLPKDPNIFYFFKNGEKDFHALRRGDDVRHIYYLDAKGRVLDKVPYTKKFIVPVFGKRSVDNKLLDKVMDSDTVNVMHEKQKGRDYLKSTDLSESSIEFHRHARTGLYEKLEKYLEHLGWKGRNCVLKMLCESGKKKHYQGSFLEEILRAVFTLPQGKKFEKTDHQEYDDAHTSSHDCDDMYRECVENETGLPQQFDINQVK